MNILVLGSEGQIGKPLCSYLEGKGHAVVRWDKEINDYLDLRWDENYDRLEIDVAWADKVVFLAFDVGGSKYISRVDKNFNYINDNVTLMQHTFSALEATGTSFLFASSQMANMHHTNYGFLKDLGERYTRSLKNGWICRFWNVYGVEEFGSEKAHVITDFIQMAHNGHIQMKTTGEEQRQFLHTDEANRAVESWVDNEWDDNTQYYDITSFRWASIKDVATTLSSLTHCKVVEGGATDELQKGIKNPPDEYILKFWKPEYSLTEGIQRVMNEVIST